MSIKNKSEYRFYLQSDLCARNIDKWHFWYKNKYPILHYQRMMRRVGYYRAMKKDSNFYKMLFFIENKRFKKNGLKLGFSMYPTTFGPGLKIGHYGNVVVNGRTRIGKNCEIQMGVNIGIHKGGVPIIGRNVYIGPGAKIFGDINIGDNVSIGANAVVNKSVPDGCVVIGVPARIISNGNDSKVQRRGTDLASKKPLPITNLDRVRMLLGFDQDLKEWTGE